jgi:hypothetical protein
MDHDALDPTGLYFGTSTGHLFASRDRGESWHPIAPSTSRRSCVCV